MCAPTAAMDILSVEMRCRVVLCVLIRRIFVFSRGVTFVTNILLLILIIEELEKSKGKFVMVPDFFVTHRLYSSDIKIRIPDNCVHDCCLFFGLLGMSLFVASTQHRHIHTHNHEPPTCWFFILERYRFCGHKL